MCGSFKQWNVTTKNELPMWITLSDSMFSERGKIEKSAYCMVTFTLSTGKNKTNLM